MSQRQVATVIGQVEYTPAPFRQIASIGVMVEYTPCIENPGDYGYADKQFYLEKLGILRDQYGRPIDTSPWETCITPEQLETLRQLFISETTAFISSYLGFLYDPGVLE